MTSPRNSVCSSMPTTGIPRYALASSKDELEQAFSLTSESYCRAGLSVDSPSQLRLTPYHLLPTSEVLVAEINTTIFSTISLFGDGELGLPMETMYAREVEKLRGMGLRLAEVGSFADRRKSPKRFMNTFAGLARLLGQVAKQRGIDTLVAVVHPRHARFYKRVLGFRQIGGHTKCPYANENPAEALYLCFEKDFDPALYDYYFGDPIAAEELAYRPWDEETLKYFLRILVNDSKIAEVVGIGGYYDWEQKKAIVSGPKRSLAIPHREKDRW